MVKTTVGVMLCIAGAALAISLLWNSFTAVNERENTITLENHRALVQSDSPRFPEAKTKDFERRCLLVHILVDKWQDRLGLQDWNLVTYCSIPIAIYATHDAYSLTNPEKIKATLWIDPYSTTDTETLVIHELMHLTAIKNKVRFNSEGEEEWAVGLAAGLAEVYSHSLPPAFQ